MQLNINPLTVFQQFGFVEDDRHGNQAQGNCVLCGKADHFFINVENKTWDCKRCGKAGGYQKFLEAVLETATKKPDLAQLAKDRGISEKTLLRAGIGRLKDRYIIPVYSRDNKILNIKIYDGDSFKNTSGCQAAMYGLWLMPKEYTEIYVAEGEWDALALMDMGCEAVIGVPGAGTFKQECVEYFTGKTTYLLYDNDLAGKNGTKKALSVLTPVTSDINVLAWPEGTEDGKDVRDVYNEHKKEALSWIKSNCKVAEQTSGSNVVLSTKEPPLPVNEVYKVFQKWLYLKDVPSQDQKNTDIYDVVFGTVLANRIPGSPVWMYVIAPPGGLKTEPLLALAGGNAIEIVESVSPAALISGINFGAGEDPSLIPRLNGKVMIIKDLTVMLGLPENERNDIWSILRGAFDGVCGRTFGNGIRRQIKSTFGIIAAVTPVIEHHVEELAAVGERFLSWRNWIPEDIAERREHIKRAMANTLCENEMKTELNNIAKRVLISKYPIPEMPVGPINERIISIAQWIALMRGFVPRDKYHRFITYKPFTEVATRLSRELLKWLMGAAMFRGTPIDNDLMRIACCIARSSVSSRLLEAVKIMYAEHSRPMLRKDICDISAETAEVLLGNMCALGIAQKEVLQNQPYYKLRKDFIKLTKESGVL